MPVSFSSAARNLFLLGSSGADVVSNFFKQIEKDVNIADVYVTTSIKYSEYDERYILSGHAQDPNSRDLGFIEKRQDNGTEDWGVTLNGTTSENLILADLEVDSNDNLIAVGYVGDIPFISRYDSNGVLDWQSTSNTADLRYKGVATAANGYYACGNTPLANNDGVSFVEKYDLNGNPLWGKAATVFGSDVQLLGIHANSRGEVVVGGWLDDETYVKGYFAKLDQNTGEILWDRTLSMTDRYFGAGNAQACTIMDVHVDGNDFIYVVGSLAATAATAQTGAGFICKYTPEGNMLWQRETPPGTTGTWRYFQVEVDTATGQIAILGRFLPGQGDRYGILTKYSESGQKIFSRIIESNHQTFNTFGNILRSGGGIGLDADSSFYYIIFTDESPSAANQTPNSYTFGKVSTSGNGLGDFVYDTGATEGGNPVEIEYGILDFEDRIGRLSDGSVRYDTSDLATNVLNPTRIMFDDYATPVANKKRQMDSAGTFQYSGSPAIRPTDFQELNLLGSTGVVVETTGGGTTTLGAQTWSNDLTTANPANGFGVDAPATDAFDAGTDTFASTSSTAIGNQLVWSPSQFPAANGPYTLEVLSRESASNGGWGQRKLIVNGTTVYDPGVDTLPTDYITVSNLTQITQVIVERVQGSGKSRIDTIKVNGTKLIDGQGITLQTQPEPFAKVVDESGKGNDGILTVAEQLKEPHPGFGSVKFDGVDDYLSMPDSQLLEILDADFTIECWIYVTGTRTEQCIFSKGRNVQCYWNDARTISLYLDSDNSSATGTSGYGVFFSANLTGTNSVLKDQWNHIAICRDNNTWKAFVNGTQKYSNVIPGLDPVYNSSDDFEIGSYANNRGQGSLANEFEGWISNFRFLKGTALYSANFTPPNTPLTSITDTSLLTCQGDTIVDARTGTPNVITANGGVAPSQLRLSPERNPDGYWEFDGTNDTIDLGTKSLIEPSSSFSIEAWCWVDSLTNECSIYEISANGNAGTILLSAGSNTDGNVGGRFLVRNTSGTNLQVRDVINNNTGEWHHYVGVHTNNGIYSNVTLYVDGVGTLAADIIDVPHPFDFTNVGVQHLGVSAGDRYLDGRIGEVRIYPSALTAAQVFQNFNATRSKYINEAPDTSLKIGPGIVYGSNLLLNYDFGNRATYDRVENLYRYSNNFSKSGDVVDFWNNSSGVYIPGGGPDGLDAWEFALTQYTGGQEGEATIQQRILPNYPAGTVTSQRWLMRSAPGYGTQTVYHKHGRNAVYGANQANVEFDITEEWSEITTTDSVYAGNTKEFFGIGTANAGVVVQIARAQLWIGSENARYVDTYGVRLTAPDIVKNLSTGDYSGTLGDVVFNSAGYFDFGDSSNDGNIITATLQGGATTCATLLGTTDSGGSCTAEAWVKFNSVSSQQVVLSGYAAADPARWDFGVNSGALEFRRYANGTTTQSSGSVSAGVWNHIAVTRGDGSDARIRIYLNGSEVGTSLLGGQLGSGEPLSIGMRSDGSLTQMLDGFVGEARTYTRFLSATEVSQNYNATRSKYGV